MGVMVNRESDSRPLGARLYDRGWRQGSLFTVPSSGLHGTDAAAPGSDPPFIQFTRNLRKNEKLILATQDCDLVASDTEEPHVEALICTPFKIGSDFLTRVERNSARYFVVDPGTGLVAQARYRALFTKQVLLHVEPTQWPSSEQRLGRFVQWLARRFDRPAIPNNLVQAFQRPVEDALRLLDEQQPSLGVAFSRVVHEIRVNMPASNVAPFTLQPIFLVRSSELGEDELRAIDTVADTLWSNVDPDVVHLSEHRILSAEELSLAEYQASRPLYLEYLSYEGDEAAGALPFGRA